MSPGVRIPATHLRERRSFEPEAFCELTHVKRAPPVALLHRANTASISQYPMCSRKRPSIVSTPARVWPAHAPFLAYR
jgi:hypothetical protein